MTGFVYPFSEGDSTNRRLLGGKGAGLCDMTQIGLPIPPGFVITTEACLEYSKLKNKLPEGLIGGVQENIKVCEGLTGKTFGDEKDPLLLSVRSGAAVSMPGMMDTILNLGLNDATVQGLAKVTGDDRFAYDSYRRFIALFCNIALGLEEKEFYDLLDDYKRMNGVKYDHELDVASLKSLIEDYKEICRRETNRDFPSDVSEQLELAIKAVFGSWNGKRAIDYRREFNITEDIANGTAVNICTMVFGNMGNTSATGVLFTRDPSTGENVLFGEYLLNAQGEDVVAGVRTPKPIIELKDELPEMYDALMNVRNILEERYSEVQDFEFTVEKNKLHILQTRNGKMGPNAWVKTSIDMVKEGLLTQEEAVHRVKPEVIEQLMHRRIDPKDESYPIATGIAASPGAATGHAIFDADEAEKRGRHAQKVILIRTETKPEDIHGFFAAQGILTSRGGKTSHAAVVARAMGKACVCGAEDILIDEEARVATMGDIKIRQDDLVTVDGTTGNVFLGEVDMIEPELSDELFQLLNWADEIRTLGVKTNVDTPEDAALAIKFGAEGVGLCRTERMFNLPERLPVMQQMIMAGTKEERMNAINRLLPMQREDFAGIFRVMQGRPVTIRLLDPPLHEFLPRSEEIERELQALKELKAVLKKLEEAPNLTKVLDYKLFEYLPQIQEIISDMVSLKDKVLLEMVIKSKEHALEKIESFSEVNPMLGHRGVRIGITYPEIYEMQARAILEAAAEVSKEGIEVSPEIMIPQVCTAQELRWVHKIAERVEKEVEAQTGVKVAYKFGTMIEVVRACMRAGRLAEVASFFSFGTNDLTQATFSFSREDAESKFLPLYNERGILQDNPFEILDVKGVGRLMLIAIRWGRKTRPDLKIGVCGEQAGEPRSIKLCNSAGIDYVSCSPYRVPIARLAAAHAEIEGDKFDLLYI
ncbi:MAG: pyruvate phosphate dikinase [Candidatus Syntrophoarchaeum sp. GoM_oil]|nr:MAG: pyruvate phosphate dikinase [Candidatus Syntrophoarchaeum sp. GoM_oil]